MLREAIRKDKPEDVKDAGDYCIFDLCGHHEASGIMFVCPHDGCGDKTHLPLKPHLDKGWNWSEETKTLSPSIQRMDEDRCKHHFSLIEGKFVP